MRGDLWKTPLLAALLFGINAYIVHNLFTAGFIDQMGSIEGVYIGLARYILAHWGDLSWFPLWYGGIPFQNAYPPLFPFTVAGTARLTGASPAVAYHAVTAVFYCLGPVTLFCLALRLSGTRAWSFAAGLAFSLFSPAALLVSEIRGDAGGILQPRRLQALLHYGEVPHLAALVLVPVAILLLDLAVRRRRAIHILAAALAFASVFVTNWLGVVALLAAALAYMLSRSPFPRGKDWLVAAGIPVYAYALAIRWIPPSTLSAIRGNAEHGGGAFPVTARNFVYLGLLALATFLAARWFERAKLPGVLRFGLLFSILTGGLALPAFWFRTFLLPQPHRYHLEMEMALVLAALFAARMAFPHLHVWIRTTLAAGFLLFCIFQIPTYRAAAVRMSRPIDIDATTEKKIGAWLDAHASGGRTYVPGSVSLWLLAFTDTPQLDGGFDQGVTNPHLSAITYQLHTGEGAGAREDEIAALWLEAFGVQTVFVGPDYYHAFRNLAKFSGSFRELWRAKEGVVYAVPQRSASQAHVIPVEAVVPREPEGGLDVEPLRPYVAALNDPTMPLAPMRWIAHDRASIETDMRPRQVLSVQIAWHPGWSATVNGEPRRVDRDRLGLIAVEARCNGRCTIELTYDGGLETALARIIGWVALAAGLLFTAIGFRTAAE